MRAGYEIHRFANAEDFLGRALDWLLRAEAEHNLILGIARRAADHPELLTEAYFATVELEGVLLGCALRTPPYKLVVTELPLEAANALCADIAKLHENVPAVLGPEATARAFAEAWCARRGTRARVGMRQRVYQLESVHFPARPAPGALRLAEMNDLVQVAAWIDAFSAESGVTSQRARELGLERIQRQELFLWEDAGTLCSMAAWSGRTPHGVRIGYVYTPPDLRAHGYASSCVAEVSQRALESGYRFCFLFTDISNPTSNAIYQRIGYTPVCDVVDYWLA